MEAREHKESWAEAWNRFWFAPRDPVVLGALRIFAGAVTLYTLLAYSFSLQDFMGKDAWYTLEDRLEFARHRAVFANSLTGREIVTGLPQTQKQEDYYKAYKSKWGTEPPLPYPETKEQVSFVDEYKRIYGNDPRMFGLPLPRTEEEERYILSYTEHPTNRYRVPPPAYPKNQDEERKVYEYMAKQDGADYRRVYATGSPIWSLWFHVTDPTWMAIWHGVICCVAFLFMIGFCTRLTSALTWMASLWYIHRNLIVLFGVDTMMCILLLYLTIGNSGGAFSVDRLIARWWSQNKLGVVNRWRRFWGMQPLLPAEIVPPAYSPTPVPTVPTNVAIRLLQVHVCIIYLAAGLTKLQGAAWWNGTAVWGTFANFEFAPMQFEIYNWVLRRLGSNQWVFELFLNASAAFTLIFEIGYAFLIWRPSTRWFYLGGAIILHGFIGLFMGLKTFSLMMLAMNMAFLKSEEIYWALRIGRGWSTGEKPPSPGAPPTPQPEVEHVVLDGAADVSPTAIQRQPDRSFSG